MKPYRIEAKVKNNRLWTAIQARFPHVRSQSEAARALGWAPSELGDLCNMKVFPARLVDGRYVYRPKVCRLADVLGQEVDYLFDPKLYAGQVPPRVTVEVGLTALGRMSPLELPPSPEDQAMHQERAQLVHEMIDQLMPREALILRRRFGIDGDEETRAAIAQDLGISSERVGQIEDKALSKLRHPARSRVVRSLVHI